MPELGAIPGVFPQDVRTVTIPTDAGGAGSVTLDWAPLQTVQFALPVLVGTATAGVQGCLSVYIDTAAKQVKLYVRSGPASSSVTAKVFLF